MKGIQNLFKLTLASLAIVPFTQGVGKTKLLKTLFTSQQKLPQQEVIAWQNNQQLVVNQIRTFSKKVEKNFLPIPKKIKLGEKGAVYYCLSTKGGKHFPSIIVQENGKEIEYRLPEWYGEWVLMNWAMNEACFPSWIEFGELENGNYYAEFLNDKQERMKPESQEQQEIINNLRKMWLETMKKFR